MATKTTNIDASSHSESTININITNDVNVNSDFIKIIGSSSMSTATRSTVEEEENDQIHPILSKDLGISSYHSSSSVSDNSVNPNTSSLPTTENLLEEIMTASTNTNTIAITNHSNFSHGNNNNNLPYGEIAEERDEETQQEQESQEQQNQEQEAHQELTLTQRKQKKIKKKRMFGKIRSKLSCISNTAYDADLESIAEGASLPSLPPVSTAMSNTSTNESDTNALQWLQIICPDDIAPIVLAYCGPQLIQNLDKTNKYWNNCLKEEATWRILCEELYKWKKGDPKPNSWKEHYRLTPCVPIDYHSVSRASKVLKTFDNNSNKEGLSSAEVENQQRCLNILLRPGKYIFKEALVIDTHPTHHVTIQSMNMPSSLPIEEEPKIFFDTGKYVGGITSFYSSVTAGSMVARGNVPHGEGAREGERKFSFREYFSCMNKRSVQVETRNNNEAEDHYYDILDMSVHSPEHVHEALCTNDHHQQQRQPQQIQKVEIFLQTRRHNEPIFRVCKGSFSIKNIYLVHHSNGVDIWNGNAAVQIQPPIQDDDDDEDNENVDNDDDEHFDNDDTSVRGLRGRTTSPLVTLESVFVTSRSGRGIVNLNGGCLRVNDCYIRDCAGTGIYVGGKGCKTDIINTDVVRNGIGANRAGVTTHVRRGVSAGHSGIYIERGRTKVLGCSVSQNSLTGISAMSPDDCFLHLQDSDLIGNGTSHQIELPPIGTLSRRNSTIGNTTGDVYNNSSNSMNNQFRSNGLVKHRSSLFYHQQRLMQQQRREEF